MTTLIYFGNTRVAGTGSLSYPVRRSRPALYLPKFHYRQKMKMNVDWAWFCQVAAHLPVLIPLPCLSSPVLVCSQKLPHTSLILTKNGLVCMLLVVLWELRLLTVYINIGMDLEVANNPYFSRENISQWVLPQKWHEYQLDIRRQLSQSGSRASGQQRRGQSVRSSSESSSRSRWVSFLSMDSWSILTRLHMLACHGRRIRTRTEIVWCREIPLSVIKGAWLNWPKMVN